MAVRNPVVLLLNCDQVKAEEIVGNNNGYTERLFGVMPRFISVNLPVHYFWPEGDNLWQIVQLRPDKSLDEIKDWVKTADFAQIVAKEIEASLQDEQPFQFDDVRVVICDGIDVFAFGATSTTGVISHIFPKALFSSVSDGRFLADLSIMPIEDLGLGLRAYNCLKRAGVQTVLDLTQRSEADLNAIPNLGRKGREETQEILDERGLQLRKED